MDRFLSNSQPIRLSRNPGVDATPLRTPVVRLWVILSRGVPVFRTPRSQQGMAMKR